MGMFSEIATEGAIRVFVAEIKKELGEHLGQPDAINALKKLGRFALAQFEWTKPDWAREYELLFTEVAEADAEANLDIDPEEFFSMERFQVLGISQRIATRAVNCTRNMKYNDPRARDNRHLSVGTMREFLALYDNRFPFTLVPTLGKKSLNAIVFAIKSAKLPFNDTMVIPGSSR